MMSLRVISRAFRFPHLETTSLFSIRSSSFQDRLFGLACFSIYSSTSRLTEGERRDSSLASCSTVPGSCPLSNNCRAVA